MFLLLKPKLDVLELGIGTKIGIAPLIKKLKPKSNDVCDAMAWDM
jgi:hypothetical protein